MEELENIFAQGESATTWNQLTEYLDNWTNAGSLEVAINYAQRELETWSDESRPASRKSWQAIQNQGLIPAWWKLVRHLDIEEDDNILQPFIDEALANITSINLIDCYLTSEELYLLAKLNKLSCLNWFDLIDSLDKWPENEPIAEILEYTETQLADWSDEYRKAAKSDWRKIREGELIPRWWKLVRSLELEAEDYQIKPLAAFVNLTRLNAWNANFVEIDDLDKLTNLTHFSWVEDLIPFSIQPITKMTNLTHLRLAMIELTDLDGFRNLENLQFLDLSYNTELVDIEDLAFLKNLKSLILDDCTEIVDFTPLSKISQLQELSLENCSSLTDISSLSSMYQLEYLSLAGCKSLTDLSPLANLNHLRKIRLTGCRGIQDFSALEKLSDCEIFY